MKNEIILTLEVCCSQIYNIDNPPIINCWYSPIRDKLFPDFVFPGLRNLPEISSLILVESLHIQTVLEDHSIDRGCHLEYV